MLGFELSKNFFLKRGKKEMAGNFLSLHLFYLMLPSKHPRGPKIVFHDEDERSSVVRPTAQKAQQPQITTKARLRQSIERHVGREFQREKCIELISSLLKPAGIVVGAKQIWHLDTGGQWEAWTFEELERFAGEALINHGLSATSVTCTKSKILDYFHRAGSECNEDFKAWLIKTVDEIFQSHINSLILSPDFSAIIRCAQGTMDLDWFQRQNASEVDHFVCAKQLYKVVQSGNVPVTKRMLQLQTHQTQSLLSTASDGDCHNNLTPQELSLIHTDVRFALQVTLGSALLGNRVQNRTLIQLSGPGAAGVFRTIQMLAGSYGWTPRLQTLANASDSLRHRLTFFEVAKSDCSTLKRALNNVRAAATLVVVLTATDLTPIPFDIFQVLPVTIQAASPAPVQTPSQISAQCSRYLTWLGAGASQWPRLGDLVIDHFVWGSILGERAIKHVIESFVAKSNWLPSKPASGATRNRIMLKDIVDPISTLALEQGYKSLVITQREIANGLESLEFDTTKTGNRLCVWYYTT